ncbi:NHL domain-containing protein [Alkaliphilus peptidifermentans]|uniref:Diguanylate cyclase (GGDEF) domain-containing protein n=1 Tax=Alkaliphilus peptidifermentans DSM 18978 TaxID=1120976 RepID=A0A1G5I3E6_9FIRM|nr:diguanylate cyclase [Alkaliphilus peptidifermentans]SCY70582.1 diguanylate cyclase (GGDEF) domain-containing protein [Alkaliphilus peptidifermentans DSM 18978]
MSRTIDNLTLVWDRQTSIKNISRNLRNKKQISIALIDIDFFTNIDAKVGGEIGDTILFNIANYLKKTPKVTVGRYGGDEFIMMFLNASEEEVKEKVYAIHKDFKKQRFIPKGSLYEKVPITISIGMAFSSATTNGSFLLLKSAETALAMAKKKGRNRVEVATDMKIQLMRKNGVVTTAVGGGLKGSCKDGEKAFKAEIAEPYGVDLNRRGDLFIVDRGNHRIIKVNYQGRVYTVAGSKDCGYLGDGGLATEALLSKPSGVAIDNNNNIYIADTGNHRIRKVDGKGIITTVAGCELDGYSGDGGSAVLAKLSRPGGVVVDIRGNVYTNDYGNNVIRMITPEGLIYTVAGSGKYGYEGDGRGASEATMDRPYGLAINPDGSMLYIADYGNNCIRQVDMKSKIITTLCGGGKAGYMGDGGDSTEALLDGPYWVCLWGEKYLLIADGNNNCIRIVNLETRRIDTLVGGKEAGYRDSKYIEDVTFNTTAGMAVDTKKEVIYVCDYANNSIRRVLMRDITMPEGI